MRFVPVLALAVPVAITAACYGPTEVAVVITTDLQCSEGPRTAIYKGMPFDSAPDAETEACEPVPNADTRIGSLVFLPSGDANGRAAVKVVLARKRNVSECEAHPEDCIVATRSFSFVKHLSRRVPIRMLSACLGKQCPDGQTCGAGGVCVSNEVTCTSDDCDVEPGGERDAGPPGLVDAGSDVGPVPLPGACGGPTGDGTITVVTGGVLGAALGAGVHYFVDGSTSKLMSVPKSGGPPSLVTPHSGIFNALAVTGADWFFAYNSAATGKTNHSLVMSDGSVLSMGSLPIATLAAVTDGNGSVAYVGRTATVERVKSSEGASTFNDKSGANRIAVDGDFVYMSTPGGIAVRHRTDATASFDEVPITPNDGQAGVAFATRGGTKVFAAGTLNGTPGIHTLNGGSPVVTVVGKTGAIKSLAVDDNFVFATDGTTIQRWIATPSGDVNSSVLYTAVQGESVDHLMADADCLYYWSSPPGIIASGVLRAIATKPAIAPGP